MTTAHTRETLSTLARQHGVYVVQMATARTTFDDYHFAVAIEVDRHGPLAVLAAAAPTVGARLFTTDLRAYLVAPDPLAAGSR